MAIKKKAAKKKAAKKKAAKKKAAKRGRPPEPDSLRTRAAEISEAWGERVTLDQVRAWREKGYPLDDPQKLRTLVLTQQVTAEDLGNLEADELRVQFLIAKIRKTQAEAGIKEIQERAELENWLTRAEGREAGAKIGALVRSFFVQLEVIFPPMLEGLPAAKQRPLVKAHAMRALADLERLTLEILSGEDITGP